MNAFSFISRFPLPAYRLLASSLTTRRIAVYQTNWSHHSKHSGYSPVAKGLGLIIANNAALLPSILSKHGRSKGDCGWNRKAAEIDLLMSWFGRKHLLIVDGDFNIPLMKAFHREIGRNIVPVFHQPPDVLERILSDCPAGFADRAICVARCQVPLVERLVGVGRVEFIPHGIDCTWFSPSGNLDKSPVFLCTGVHRRNFAMLEEIANRLKYIAPKIRIKMVLPRKYLPPNMDTTNLDVEFDVSDERLRQLYRTSWGLVMPVEAATANNSVLESLACGTPVIATKCEGIMDYVTDKSGILCQDSAEAYVAAITTLADNFAIREKMSRASRDAASFVDWTRIRSRIREFLERPV